MRWLSLAIFWLLIASSPAASSAKPPLVLAAASLQESLNAAADAWASQHHQRPILAFAGSSALARQIEAGAPADMFISADEDWMNDVQSKGFIKAGTRSDFLTNRLVLIAPLGSSLRIRIKPHFPLAGRLGTGKLAMADPDSVPAGRYGRAALTALGTWPSIESKVVRAENVRAALAFVERGAAAAGIVYDTDRLASHKVLLVGTFPENTHPPIAYPIAILKSSKSTDADGFRRFLISPAGKRIFARFGFGGR